MVQIILEILDFESSNSDGQSLNEVVCHILINNELKKIILLSECQHFYLPNELPEKSNLTLLFKTFCEQKIICSITFSEDLFQEFSKNQEKPTW